MPNSKRNSDGQFASKGMMGPMRDNPWTSAAIAAGAAGIGAFLWSKRNQLGESFSSGMDRLSEMKSQRMGTKSGDGRSQEEISQEALTLKETGKKSKGARGPNAQQDSGSNQEAKARATA